MELINRKVAEVIFNNLDQKVKDDIVFTHLEEDPEEHKLTFDEFYEYLEMTLESNFEYDTHCSILQAADAVKNTDDSENNYITINVSDDTKLIAEKNTDNGFAEIMVFIRKDDASIQDLVRVGQQIEFLHSKDSDDVSIKTIPGEYYVDVYDDETDEDYTHQFIITEYEEPGIYEWQDFEDGSGALYINGEKKASYDLNTKEIYYDGSWYSISDWNVISVDTVHEFIDIHVVGYSVWE